MNNRNFLLLTLWAVFVTIWACIITSMVVNITNNDKPHHEYQLDLNRDGSATVYDGSRLVGTCETDSLTKLFLKDNL